VEGCKDPVAIIVKEREPPGSQRVGRCEDVAAPRGRVFRASSPQSFHGVLWPYTPSAPRANPSWAAREIPLELVEAHLEAKAALEGVPRLHEARGGLVPPVEVEKSGLREKRHGEPVVVLAGRLALLSVAEPKRGADVPPVDLFRLDPDPVDVLGARDGNRGVLERQHDLEGTRRLPGPRQDDLVVDSQEDGPEEGVLIRMPPQIDGSEGQDLGAGDSRCIGHDSHVPGRETSTVAGLHLHLSSEDLGAEALAGLRRAVLLALHVEGPEMGVLGRFEGRGQEHPGGNRRHAPGSAGSVGTRKPSSPAACGRRAHFFPRAS